jgi:hypothetical protein
MEDIILYKKQRHSINLNNSGTMNQQNLDFAKRTLLFDVIREHAHLVKTIQHYPQGDISDVDMEIDCVIMSRKRYNNFLLIEETLEQALNFTAAKNENSIKKYINFPKLKL